MSYALRLPADHDGRRLDRTIRSIWPEIPLSAIMRALRKGSVRLDSVRAREPGTRVSAGQELFVPWEAPGTNSAGTAGSEAHASAERHNSRTVPVIWRCDGAMAVNKPAGLLVQPDVKGGDSVITRIWGMVEADSESAVSQKPAMSGVNKVPGFAPAAVHRLDRNTTGVLIAALRGDWLRALELMFKERRVGKRYLAVTCGRAPDYAEIDAPLLKDAEANTVCVSKDGKTALTRCRRIAGDGELSLVSAELLTGRTHQARVHLAHIGCPVLGDRKYGNFDVNRRYPNVKRPLLHAFELSFPQKVPDVISDLAERTFRADIPADILAVMEQKGFVKDRLCLKSRLCRLEEIL